MNQGKADGSITINPHNSVLSSAVYRAVNLNASTVASLPVHVNKITANGRERDNTVAAAKVIRRPNNIMTPVVYRQTEMAFVQLWGNSYAMIERNGNGEPESTILIHPSKVTPVLEDGMLFYSINGKREPIPDRNMVHIRGLGFEQLQGKSVIRYAAEDIELSIEARRELSNFYKNNAIPSMAIIYDTKKRDKDQRDLDKKSWNEAHRGSNTRGTAMLYGNPKIETLSMPLADAEVIETLNLTVRDIARWFGTPPHKLFDHEFSTFTNSGQINREYHQDTLSYWLATIEAEYNQKLLSPREQETHQIRFNVKGLLRGDIQAQGDFYVKMLQNGVFTINDVLRLEDLNTTDENGDKRLVQMNMTTLDKVGESETTGSDPSRLAAITSETASNLTLIKEYTNFMRSRQNGKGQKV